MEVTKNSIGYDGGIYSAVAQGDNCVLYKENEDSVVIGLETYEAGEVYIFPKDMRQKEVNVKEGTTYFLLKNPAPEKDVPGADIPSLKMRKIGIGNLKKYKKVFYDNLTVDKDNLSIGGFGGWYDEIALPKPGDGYLTMLSFRGYDLDLTEYKCYKLRSLDFNSIKIGKMGNPLPDTTPSYASEVSIYGLDNVIEFGGVEPNIRIVYIYYCGDETILTILRGIDGHKGPKGYVAVRVSLREGQEITDEMRSIASQNGIELY
jgi:hypothetical protein